MAALDHVVKLDDLFHKAFPLDKVVCSKYFTGAPLKVLVGRRGKIHTREQIVYDSLEEGNIISEELRHVYIHNAFKNKDFLCLLRTVLGYVVSCYRSRAAVYAALARHTDLGWDSRLFASGLVLQILSCGQNRLDGPHSIVIMVLRGKLLGTESVCLNNLFG